MHPAADEVSANTLRHEIFVVALLTLVGAGIRIWGLGQLGLNHFDEGIYALAGLWSISPGGLAALDPTIVAYAPPGFPILVGTAYMILGVGDLAAILTSVVAGTLTIPAIAWVARRTFGAGAGAAGSALVAVSGFHVGFSRMALTDVSFLLLWVLSLGLGQRFLERPGFVRALLLGLGVGLSQLFKYNGWLVGIVVPLAAIVGLVRDPAERSRGRLLRVWGYGMLAALVAAAMYWPWFRFVANHGGYAALLRHQQSYMGGISSWVSHWKIQLEQISALSGGPPWNAAGWAVSCTTAGFVLSAMGGINPRLRAGLLLLLTPVVAFAPTLPWWMGVPWLAVGWKTAGHAERLLRIAWIELTVLTPFYHPYARLWLPLLSLGWLAMASLIVGALKGRGQAADQAAGARTPGSTVGARLMLVCGLLAILQGVALWRSAGRNALPGVLVRGDSIKLAVGNILADLPKDVSGLRMLVRPPVTYYLGGRTPARVEPDLERLCVSGNPNQWAIVDLAQLGQERRPTEAASRLLAKWEKVGEYSTNLPLPTLLDVDPGAASSGRSDFLKAPLWLLRPRNLEGRRR